MIIVCSLDKLPHTIADYNPGRVISLMDERHLSPNIPSLRPEDHLKCAQEMTLGGRSRGAAPDPARPDPAHPNLARPNLVQIIDFAAGHDWRTPLLIHCQLGISRSPAAAFIIQCALEPARPELDIAQKMRALSSRIQPNFAMIVEADDLLQRCCRMLDAMDAIDGGEATRGALNTPAPDPLVIPFAPTPTGGVPLSA